MEFNSNGSSSSSSSGFGFSPSSSFESLSTSDLDSGFLFPKYPSSSFYRKAPVGPGPRFLTLAGPDGGGAGGGTHHFLDACHLCRRPLGCGRDIFMYRGDTPFCSEECREQQIEMDEAGEKRAKMGQKQQQQQQQVKGPSKSENIRVRVSGTVVAG